MVILRVQFLTPKIIIENKFVSNIRNDRWVPGLKGFKIISPRRELNEGGTVNSLMSTVHGMWNEALIRRIFTPVEADAILSIVVRSRNC